MRVLAVCWVLSDSITLCMDISSALPQKRRTPLDHIASQPNSILHTSYLNSQTLPAPLLVILFESWKLSSAINIWILSSVLPHKCGTPFNHITSDCNSQVCLLAWTSTSNHWYSAIIFRPIVHYIFSPLSPTNVSVVIGISVRHNSELWIYKSMQVLSTETLTEEWREDEALNKICVSWRPERCRLWAEDLRCGLWGRSLAMGWKDEGWKWRRFLFWYPFL